MTSTNASYVGNRAMGGGGGAGDGSGGGGDGGSAHGGAVGLSLPTGGTATLSNTVVAGNRASTADDNIDGTYDS